MVKNIYVVDDNPIQTETVKLILEQQKDFNVITANSGVEFLQLLKENNPPDLILIDIMMPEINGWQLFERLKRNEAYKNVPIIFLTARNDKTAVNAGEFLGDDYIMKPYDANDLIHRIRKVMEIKR